MHLRAFLHAAVALALVSALVFVLASTKTGGAEAWTGTIVGRVSDSLDQPLSGVVVTILPEAGGNAARTETGRDGTYRTDNLVDGTYRVDFDVHGFDLARRNHVRVSSDAPPRADVSLHISAICDCVTRIREERLRERQGDVLDERGRPLPHARLEIGGRYAEVAYADARGRFAVRLPVKDAWPVTASDSGFAAATQNVSAATAEPITFRLALARTVDLAETERFARSCRCPGDLFTHPGR